MIAGAVALCFGVANTAIVICEAVVVGVASIPSVLI